MKQLKLKVANRQETGRRQARRLRAQGRIPGVIYGKAGSRALTIEEHELRQLLRQMSGGAAIVEVEDNAGHKVISIVQEVMRDAVTDRLTHVDLHEISANEKMRATVPVHLVGESVGVKDESGVIEFFTHQLEVRCLPKNLPEYIEVNISGLHVGESVHISNLLHLEGVEFMADKETTVVACAEPALEVPTTEGEAAKSAEPAPAAKGGAKAATPAKGAPAKTPAKK